MSDFSGRRSSFANNTRLLKDLARILVYFIAVIVLGALLAPPLYWLGQAVAARGVMTFLSETPFQKFFNRAVLIAAILLIWPMTRWLRIGGWRELGLDPDPQWWRRLLVGFTIAGCIVATMAVVYVGFGIYHWKDPLPKLGVVPALLISAICVAVLEEALFRGAIFGLFRRSLPPRVALFCVTFIFAAVHFLKPLDSLTVPQVTWLSGFAVLPYLFHQFGEPMTLLAGFTTIFTLGWVVGAATLHTRSLWLAIGFHAGLVFVKMSFAKFTKRDAAYLPWVGERLEIGLVPVAALALGGVLVWLWLKYVDRSRIPSRA
jgi:membrane protease YdiL (CAAX protease family)